MNESHFDAFVQALTDGSLSRRTLTRGLAAAVAAVGFFQVGGDDLDARKRKKNKKRKRRNRTGRGNAGGGNNGGGGNPGGCPFTLCNGQCVDLNTDPNNCGACGAVCGDNVCVGGLCVEIIGEPGPGEDQFESPFGIAVNGDGVAYVADSGNERVVVLGGGPFGVADLVRPTGLAVNNVTGDVYTTDVALHMVVRWASDGSLLDAFGSFGSGVNQFSSPSGIAVDPAGGNQIFIADTGNHRIQRMTASGFALDRFGRQGSNPGEFDQPKGVAISADRVVFVADTGNDRVQVLDRDGGFIRAFGTTGSGPGQFNSPVALGFAPDGTLFVVDQGNNRVQQFTAGGQFLKAFGSAGNGPGQFNGPSGIAFDDDAIGVVDTGNNRIQGFFPGGSVGEQGGLAARSGNRRARASSDARRTRGAADSHSRH